MDEPPHESHALDMAASILPETALERELLNDPRLRAGLDWRAPCLGHPEGRAGNHVAAMLAAIGRNDSLREDLRFLALVHDSFKREVRPREPWPGDNDHATLARRFAEHFTHDERLLAALELHVRDAFKTRPIFARTSVVEARIFRGARATEA
jgi:hypothetical protein